MAGVGQASTREHEGCCFYEGDFVKKAPSVEKIQRKCSEGKRVNLTVTPNGSERKLRIIRVVSIEEGHGRNCCRRLTAEITPEGGLSYVAIVYKPDGSIQNVSAY